jgi:uroporphyrin-III C-methyltransferase/precorrin-2 dehydrogenase/sirohydrochlorin ferrochelatase
MAATADDALFPTFLKLSGLPVLVVGGGPVAAGKLEALAPTGARVTVVAPEVCDAVAAAGVEVHRRGFETSDLDGVWFVVSAATPEVNRAVSEAARARRLFVNAVDDPPNASAYLGGVVRRSGATIAISTSGRAPALAGLLREGIDAMLPTDLEEWFAQGDALKAVWRSSGVPMADRRPQLAEALLSRYCGTLDSCRRRTGNSA